jgi:hypothetical protein
MKGMSREEKRAYLKAFNSPSWSRSYCDACGEYQAVAIDIFMQEDYGEGKGKEYPMLELFCLNCKETTTEWEENE